MCGTRWSKYTGQIIADGISDQRLLLMAVIRQKEDGSAPTLDDEQTIIDLRNENKPGPT